MRLILILSLLVTAPAFAQKIKDKFDLTCQVELINGGSPKLLTRTFRSPELDNMGYEIPFGPHFLKTNISMTSDAGFDFRPTLNVTLHSGHPVQKMFYYNSVSGFSKGLINEPLLVHGFLFKDIKHEKVDYTRVDFKCILKPI